MSSPTPFDFIHPRRGALATRMKQQSWRQLPDNVLNSDSSNVLDNVSMISNESTEHHQQTTTTIPLSSQTTVSDSSTSSPQQPLIISSTTPSSSMSSIPTPPPEYHEYQRLMDSILVVSYIAVYSYLLAYDRVYGGPQSDIQFYHYVTTPPRSLLHSLLLGRRAGLVSAEEFMQYGIKFPSLTPPADSNTPIPPRFEFPVLRYPRISRIPVVYPINAPSIMHKRTDWDAQVQQFLDYYRPHVYEPTPASRREYHVWPSVDEQFRHLLPTPVFPLRRPKQYSRNARAIKPLPKRARPVAQASQTTAFEFVTRTVADVGSVIVRGVKRLKDGLDERGILKKRRLL